MAKKTTEKWSDEKRARMALSMAGCAPGDIRFLGCDKLKELISDTGIPVDGIRDKVNEIRKEHAARPRAKASKSE